MKNSILSLLLIIVLTSPILAQQELPKSEKPAMIATCFACHNPKAPSHDEILAPPFAAVKFRYQMMYKTKEEFAQAVYDYVTNPTEEKALMFGAVRRFGVMPALPLPEEQIKSIAYYIYDNDVEAPEWFAEHFEEQHGKGGNRGFNH